MSPDQDSPQDSDVSVTHELTPPTATTSPIPDSGLPPPSPSPLPATPGWRALVAPAWFLAGILVGLAAFFLISQFTRPAPVAPTAILDEATVRKAAREGLVEAIQQLQSQSGQSGSQAPQAVTNAAFAVREANRLGNADAPVMIVEYADFQCPFCGRHHTTVAPTLLKEYVDTGKATYVYKHLAFLGPESVYAAVAAECAADQGMFWEYHDYLFEHQGGENEGAFNKEKLIGFGQELGLDASQFDACLESDATIGRVQADTEEAQNLGVSSTPTFFINGQPLVGLTSPQNFQAAIEQALNP